ncbi:hypothetical protein [Natrinema salaciae]|uniref:Uncharacterized protein n=1 Tax=Natrinema salaciae TaxID=1186196 RepID=A0A1H9FC27_9EURY|nr:hypothetical protein [Natrinema salaciae]SEQ35501.1 hypothetical protein SAMN04489841_1538 [Natrinema salaciae]
MASAGIATLGVASFSTSSAAAASVGDEWSRNEETVYEYGGIDTYDILYGHDLQVNYLEKNHSSANEAFYLTFEMLGTGYERQRAHGSNGEWKAMNFNIVERIGFEVSTPDSGVGIYQTPAQEEMSSAAGIPEEDAYTYNELLADAALAIATRGASKMVDRDIWIHAASDIVSAFVQETKDTDSTSTLASTWTNQDVLDLLSPRPRHTMTCYTKFRVEVPDTFTHANLALNNWSEPTSSGSGRQTASLDITVDLDNSPGGGIS